MGQTIKLPPWRYILLGNIPSEPTQTQLSEIDAFLREFHTTAAAPEPLSPNITSPNFFVERQPKTENIHDASHHPESPTHNDGDSGRKRKFSGGDIQNNPGPSSDSSIGNQNKQRAISIHRSPRNESMGS
jgi:hypothetical protein